MKKCAVKRENYDLLKTYLLAREDFLGKTAIISIDFPSTYCESADNGLSEQILLRSAQIFIRSE